MFSNSKERVSSTDTRSVRLVLDVNQLVVLYDSCMSTFLPKIFTFFFHMNVRLFCLKKNRNEVLTHAALYFVPVKRLICLINSFFNFSMIGDYFSAHTRGVLTFAKIKANCTLCSNRSDLPQLLLPG